MMDRYDELMDKYRAEQRFRKEIQEEVAQLKKQQTAKLKASQRLTRAAPKNANQL